MPLTNYPQGVSSFGIPIIGSGPVLTTGNVFFVNNAHPRNSDGNLGTSADTPLRTIANAISKCTANNADFVIVGPGHAESITTAAGLVIDKAGVTLLGIGRGSLRPTLTFSGVVGADLDINAANCTIQNFLFVGEIDALTGPIDVNAADVSLLNVETRDTVSTQSTQFIVTDATCDRFQLNGWTHIGDVSAGAVSAIHVVGGSDISIENFKITGNFSTAAIRNSTSNAFDISIGSRSFGNFIRNRNAADVLVTMGASSTGAIDNILGRLQDDAANITEAFVFAGGIFGNNLYLVNAAGERAIQFNATQSTDA